MLLSLSTMAVPSTLARLNFLLKPSLFTFWRNQLPLNCSFAASSRHISSVATHVRNRASERDGDLVVLGIETSCDDTAAAVVRSNGEILSQVVSSQADLLAKYGGVAPKMAEEAHSQVIDQVVQEALEKAYMTEKDLTAVAVTIGPGLSLCLRGT